jgi:glycosyltransferase involved in cell wall biosynthesis
MMACFTTKITGTSDAVMDEYAYNKWPYLRKRVAPVYCGFDTEKFSYATKYKDQICREMGWNKNAKIALFAGRIGQQDYDTAQNQKNPVFAYQMATYLVNKSNEWHFIFAGFKGRTGEEMEAETQKKNLGEKIRFLGLRADMSQLMSAADLLVFPSLWEGLGMVAVEAQASGLPVLMSDSIPKEAIIDSGLVHIKNLNEGPEKWAEYALTTIQYADRTNYVSKVKESPFAIPISMKNLALLYS